MESTGMAMSLFHGNREITVNSNGTNVTKDSADTEPTDVRMFVDSNAALSELLGAAMEDI